MSLCVRARSECESFNSYPLTSITHGPFERVDSTSSVKCRRHLFPSKPRSCHGPSRCPTPVDTMPIPIRVVRMDPTRISSMCHGFASLAKARPQSKGKTTVDGSDAGGSCHPPQRMEGTAGGDPRRVVPPVRWRRAGVAIERPRQSHPNEHRTWKRPSQRTCALLVAGGTACQSLQRLVACTDLVGGPARKSAKSFNGHDQEYPQEGSGGQESGRESFPSITSNQALRKSASEACGGASSGPCWAPTRRPALW